MATTSPRGVRTPDLSDLFKPTSQMATMAGDIDDAVGDIDDQTRFAYWSNGTNQNLSGNWSIWENTFVPPSEWGTWGALVVSVANLLKLVQGDVVESLIVASPVNGPKQEDIGGTARAIETAATLGPLAGTHTFGQNIRNTTATRGTVFTSWMHLVAYQLT